MRLFVENISSHNNKLEEFEIKIIEFEEMIEQWLIFANSCCEMPYNKKAER